WHVDMRGADVKTSRAVGRALLRHDGMPDWDIDQDQLVCPETSKTCVLFVCHHEFIYEPTEADLAAALERITPEPVCPWMFHLKYWGIGYYEGWMHDEGTLVHVCRYPEPDKTDWKHWLAATSDRLVPFQRKGGFDIAEE